MGWPSSAEWGLHFSSAMAISQMSLPVRAQILLPICKIVAKYPHFLQNCYKISSILAIFLQNRL